MAKENCHRRIQNHSGQVSLGAARPILENSRPIGVFDSGVGGLSVLRALQAEMPSERFIYVADNGYAPYGERDDEILRTRSHAIADYLIATHNIKALVVACNTATAAAIHTLRSAYKELPIVGIEPALKPAAAASKTGVVGVMATRATLNSEKFSNLLASLQGSATFLLQPCDGLADAIERSAATRIQLLCKQYTTALGHFGNAPGEIDCLVLGCTHYAFAASELHAIVGQTMLLIEGGTPVAKQTRRLLEQSNARATDGLQPLAPLAVNETMFYSTGDAAILDKAVSRWMQIDVKTEKLNVG